MGSSVLAVPALDTTSARFRAELVKLARRHEWSPDHLAAIISTESRFRPSARNPLPGQTATGLIQFTEATAKSLGTSTAKLARMSATQQLPFVEKYFARAGVPADARRVDFYLAAWGASPGLPMDHELATEGDGTYELNAGLDANGDKTIRTADLDATLGRTMGRAKGERLATTGNARLRRIAQSEDTDDIEANAVRILEQHTDNPLGTEIPFRSAGVQYVGRIEEHSNAPRGVSVLEVVEGSLQQRRPLGGVLLAALGLGLTVWWSERKGR